MKIKYGPLLIGLLVLAVFNTVTAQSQLIKSAEQMQIDSLQRIVMRDSLQINDSLVTQIFTMRDSYLRQVIEVRLDSTLTELQQYNEVSIIRTQTNENIKSLLGSVLYDRYIQMISDRIHKRSIIGTPLASDTGSQ